MNLRSVNDESVDELFYGPVRNYICKSLLMYLQLWTDEKSKRFYRGRVSLVSWYIRRISLPNTTRRCNPLFHSSTLRWNLHWFRRGLFFLGFYQSKGGVLPGLKFSFLTPDRAVPPPPWHSFAVSRMGTPNTTNRHIEWCFRRYSSTSLLPSSHSLPSNI